MTRYMNLKISRCGSLVDPLPCSLQNLLAPSAHLARKVFLELLLEPFEVVADAVHLGINLGRNARDQDVHLGVHRGRDRLDEDVALDELAPDRLRHLVDDFRAFAPLRRSVRLVGGGARLRLGGEVHLDGGHARVQAPVRFRQLCELRRHVVQLPR